MRPSCLSKKCICPAIPLHHILFDRCDGLTKLLHIRCNFDASKPRSSHVHTPHVYALTIRAVSRESINRLKIHGGGPLELGRGSNCTLQQYIHSVCTTTYLPRVSCIMSANSSLALFNDMRFSSTADPSTGGQTSGLVCEGCQDST